MAQLYVVGIGPGGLRHLTPAAKEALGRAEVVIGYKTYLDLVAPLLWGKEIISSGMRSEVERCEEALLIAAEGRDVALVSGGDAGIYGMAGLVLELLAPGRSGSYLEEPPEVVVVPGISAVNAAAAVLGAPLMHDFAVISLSDLLTPWELICRRLAAAADADFVVALYNPRSKGRQTQLEEAQAILLTHRSPETPVGIVRHACRDGQQRIVTTLGQLLQQPVDMASLVIIGNSSTFVDPQGRMVTPRGYATSAAGEGALEEAAEELAEGLAPEAAEGVADLLALPPVPGRALMVCGTGSDVGKSVLSAGLCRLLLRRGYRVAPFKAQNMALNSAVTPEGGEIGRAQALQAMACGIPPHTDMNPVLLKPTSDTGSQVVIQGKPVGNMRVAEYAAYKPLAFQRVRESYARLAAAFDLVVVEGAGSIAEINLQAGDIANLRMAALADCKALLVADIDRGGVFAQILGTLELLEPAQRARIAGVLVNKFRGDASLLAPGLAAIEARTGVPVLGVIPWCDVRLPEEDSVALGRRARQFAADDGQRLRIGVVRLPRISNYTDFDSLEAEPDVELCYLEEPMALAACDLVLLPGSKATIPDLQWLRESGLFDALRAYPGPLFGICGGFQMLGREVRDPFGIESSREAAAGLGLLDVETLLLAEKLTHQVAAELALAGERLAPGCTAALAGYEIHMGETQLGADCQPFATITRRSGKTVSLLDGAVSLDGRVAGTYLHGIFDNAGFRRGLLNRLRQAKGLPVDPPPAAAADPLEQLADHLERHLDLQRLLDACGIR